MAKGNISLVTLSDIFNNSLPNCNSLANSDGMMNNLFDKIAAEVLSKGESNLFKSFHDDLIRGFKSEQELKTFLKNRLNLLIPDKVNCGKPEHTSPFNFVADIMLENVFDCMVIANRGGAKSYNGGLIQFLLANRYPMYEGVTLGGSGEQSMKTYEAMSSFWQSLGASAIENLKGERIGKTTTQWKNGAEVTVLCASQKSVRGPHSNCLLCDEVDEMDWDVLQAALQIPMTRNSIPSRTIMLSTYHKVSGSVARLLGDVNYVLDDDELSNNKFLQSMKIYKYCIFEVLESCRDYSCSTCAISSICPGQHMKHATGYYKMDDFIKKINTISKPSLMSEWLCERPSRKGLVYADYDDVKHTVDVGYVENVPVKLSVDFGFSQGHEYSVGFFQEHENYKLPDGRNFTGDIMFDEIFTIPKTNKDIIEQVKSRPYCKIPSQVAVVVDSAAKGHIAEWKQEGFRVIPVRKVNNSVIVGINMVLNKLNPVKGEPTLLINRKCRGALVEKNNYKWGANGEPIKQFDNSWDMIRYYCLSKKSLKRISVVHAD